jgi:hypothetical protein
MYTKVVLDHEWNDLSSLVLPRFVTIGVTSSVCLNQPSSFWKLGDRGSGMIISAWLWAKRRHAAPEYSGQCEYSDIITGSAGSRGIGPHHWLGHEFEVA